NLTTSFWQLSKEGNDKWMYGEFPVQGGLMHRRMHAHWKDCYFDSHDCIINKTSFKYVVTPNVTARSTMKYHTVARSLSILAICFLLTNTVEAYLVHIYATDDSYWNPIDTCVPYVTNCDGHGTKLCNGQEAICAGGTLLDCEVPDDQWSCAHVKKTNVGTGDVYYATDKASCFAYKGYENGAWEFHQVDCT
ncbi:3504_t:CDS:2, partial [Ambispora gerdemannii]